MQVHGAAFLRPVWERGYSQETLQYAKYRKYFVEVFFPLWKS